jgi:HD-GYP domain-containing protein (c-di-GMP phosphodiesterase class II)
MSVVLSFPTASRDALAADFLAEWEDASLAIEQALVRIDGSTDTQALLAELFRRVHSMKSNLRMMHLDAGADVLHVLEDTLEDMRRGDIAFDGVFADLVLLLVHRARGCAERALAGERGAWDATTRLLPMLRRMRFGDGQARAVALEVLAELDPGYAAAPPPAAATLSPREREADLSWFRSLSQAVETRIGLGAGATARMAEMAQQMNRLAGEPIDAQQLAAAVYLHDLGMAQLPVAVLDKLAALDEIQPSPLQQHPAGGAAMLRHMPAWGEASRIVLEHHERVDGRGYPQGLRGDAIAPGARLLAVVDAFDAMTRSRAHRQHPRPLLRAVAEINSLAGRQFDAYWVGVFNTWIREYLVGPRG